jgi:hypothetical protein
MNEDHTKGIIASRWIGATDVQANISYFNQMYVRIRTEDKVYEILEKIYWLDFYWWCMVDDG